MQAATTASSRLRRVRAIAVTGATLTAMTVATLAAVASADRCSTADASPIAAQRVTANPPHDRRERTIVTIADQAPLYASPGGRLLTTAGHGMYEHGSVWVVKRRGPWLGIPTIQRRSGRLGWVRMTSARTLATTRLLVRVKLSARRMRVTDGARQVMGAPVAIGSRRSPSPTGLTSVSGRIAITPANGYASTRTYGPVVVALRRWQPLPSPGRPHGGILAFHGGDPSTIGKAASGGCFRMRTADLLRLAAIVRAGTPVIIAP